MWGPHVGEYPAVIPRERSIQEIFPYLQHGVAIYLTSDNVVLAIHNFNRVGPGVRSRK